MEEYFNKTKYEVLAPAGSYECMLAAFNAGADAVYVGGQLFGARAFANNFNQEELIKAIDYAHMHNKKLFLTVNTLLKNQEIDKKLIEYLTPLYEAGLDAVIVQDFGVLSLVKEHFPKMDIHASTQMTVTGEHFAKVLKDYGVSRIVPARELSLKEIESIYKETGLEIECFVHGALCYSYSGMCLLSSLIGARSGNRGRCAQPCRLPYDVLFDNETKKEQYPLSPKDLCTLKILPKILKAGVYSLKIEGRMKSAYYVATIIRAYRNMIDACFEGAAVSDDIHFWLDELQKVSHRPYTTGFYYGKPEKGALTLDDSQYIRPYDFIGVVHDYDEATGIATIEQRNHFRVGDTVEFFSPQYGFFQQEITEMWDKNGEPITVAPHAQQMVRIPVVHPVYDMDLMRKQVGDSKK